MNEYNPMISGAILRFLKNNNCDFEIQSPGIFRLRVQPEVCVHEAYILIAALDDGFSLQGIIPFIVPDDKTDSIYKFVNLVNIRLPQGSFVYHQDFHELRYRYYCACDCYCNLPEIVINKAIYHVGDIMEQHLIGICRLLFSACSPHEAAELCTSHPFDDDGCTCITLNEAGEDEDASFENDFGIDSLFEKFGIERELEDF